MSVADAEAVARAAIDLDAFRRAYREAVAELLPFLGEERLHAIGRHNPGWGAGRFDVRGYLEASETRYAQAIELFGRSGRTLDGLAALDVGGFMGAFPLALRRLGVEVALAERYDYYGGAFDDLRAHLEAAGIEVWDLDMTMPAELPGGRRFGLVTCMALLEHLASSPRTLMENMHAALEPDGQLLVEVPNLAYWPKRLAVLCGGTVHPPLADVYEADDPFTGHHREYTEGDLRQLLTLAGFELRDLVSFNYTPQDGRGPLGRLLDWPRRNLPGAREVLLARATLPDSDGSHYVGPRENAYGSVKRLRWIERHLRPGERILEVGCGTGYMITMPLLAAGHDVRATDLDPRGIAYGREVAEAAGLDAERLAAVDLREMEERFDVVILSEVLEHQSDEGVAELLGLIHERLVPGGRLLVTVPNGYGWFELESALWFRARLGALVQLLRLDVLVRLLKRRRVGEYVDAAHPSTFDASPHLQRFTLRSIGRRLEDAGFRVTERTGSVLAAGPFSNLAITGLERWMDANNRFGTRFPALASGFFVAAERV
jgi:2-polyprenyl-3-methyl-5-hydroxy-6-metoxy-1,4-benzoquinol methylase